ncbi:MAG: hypothetical protein A2V62_11320 [Nitrospirae bacterium RBG_19FT_COMBO_58_9]|nr:MAG: hypothetical protein A2V62_11320 [Nitrospirae bacterium RBG_19FT_COMBO_58_9]
MIPSALNLLINFVAFPASHDGLGVGFVAWEDEVDVPGEEFDFEEVVPSLEEIIVMTPITPRIESITR